MVFTASFGQRAIQAWIVLNIPRTTIAHIEKAQGCLRIVSIAVRNITKIWVLCLGKCLTLMSVFRLVQSRILAAILADSKKSALVAFPPYGPHSSTSAFGYPVIYNKKSNGCYWKDCKHTSTQQLLGYK